MSRGRLLILTGFMALALAVLSWILFYAVTSIAGWTPLIVFFGLYMAGGLWLMNRVAPPPEAPRRTTAETRAERAALVKDMLQNRRDSDENL